jgi:hypothetical protein
MLGCIEPSDGWDPIPTSLIIWRSGFQHQHYGDKVVDVRFDYPLTLYAEVKHPSTSQYQARRSFYLNLNTRLTDMTSNLSQKGNHLISFSTLKNSTL